MTTALIPADGRAVRSTALRSLVAAGEPDLLTIPPELASQAYWETTTLPYSDENLAEAVAQGRHIIMLTARINAEHTACEIALNDGLQHALKAGEMLLQVKKLCGHGKWLPWLQLHFKGSLRTAQTYMRVFRSLPKLPEPNAQRAAHLTLRGALSSLATSAYNLAAQSADAQDGALEAWEAHGCKNAHQAVCRADRERVEAQNRRCCSSDGRADHATPVAGPAPAIAASGEAAATEGQRHKALTIANQVIDLLKKIGVSNPYRRRAFQMVRAWAEQNE